MMKKICLILLVAVAISFGSHAFAETYSWKGEFLVPQLGANEVKLDSATYKAGDTVTGTFKIQNQYKIFFNNITYKVSLIGGDTNSGLAEASFEESAPSAPFSLAADEEKEIKFSYRIPAYATGKDFAIQITLYSDEGEAFGWGQSSEINITGGLPEVVIKSVSIKNSNGGKSGLNEQSPAISASGIKDDSLEVTIDNPSSQKLSLKPEVKIYDPSKPAAPLAKVEGGVLDIGVHGEKSWSVPLPTFGYKAGLYMGIVSLVDASGQKHSKQVSFWYLVGNNETVKVNNFYSDKISLKAGEIANIGLRYELGASDNTRSMESYDFKVVVELFNERDELVASYTAPKDQIPMGIFTIPMKALKDAKALRGVVTIYEGDRELAKVENIFSADYDKEHYFPMRFDFGVVSVALGLSAILILALYLFRKGKINKTVFMIVFGIIIVLAVFMIDVEQTRAYVLVSKSHSCQPNPYISISGITPSDHTVFTAGDKLYDNPRAGFTGGSGTYGMTGRDESFGGYGTCSYTDCGYPGRFLIGKNTIPTYSTSTDTSDLRDYVYISGEKGQSGNVACTSEVYLYIPYEITKCGPATTKPNITQQNGKNLCTYGTASTVTNNSQTYTWTCNPDKADSNNDHVTAADRQPPLACTQQKCASGKYYDATTSTCGTKVNGSCNTTTMSSDNNYSTFPTNSSLCFSGIPVNKQTWANRYTWDCQGAYTGTTMSCGGSPSGGAFRTASCGSSDCAVSPSNCTFYPAPKANLCGVGTASSVSTSTANRTASLYGTYYDWSCTNNPGNTYYCLANVNQTPSCGSATGNIYYPGQFVDGSKMSNACNVPYNPDTSATGHISVPDSSGATTIYWTCQSGSTLNCFATQEACASTLSYCSIDNTCYNSKTDTSSKCFHAKSPIHSIISMTVPKVISSGSVCPVTWTIDEYNNNTLCRIYNEDNPNIGGMGTFTPSGTTGVSYPTAITSDTRYRMECWQSDDSSIATSTDEAVCRINFSSGEFN